MEWLFITTPTVNALVFLFTTIVAVGLTCYFLYRVLLRSMVEYGETHPANLRRGLWCLFVLLIAGAYLGLLWQALTLVGKILPPSILMTLVLAALFSMRRS